MRASLDQGLKNAFEHRVGLLQYFVIPESDHAKSTPREIASAFEVVEQIIRMLPSVDLDDQPSSHADEIDDVSSHRLLSPEAIRAKMAIAQVTP